MFLKSLRTGITINLAVLLLLSMLLINFVMFIVTHEVLVGSEVEKGRRTLFFIKQMARSRANVHKTQAFDHVWIKNIQSGLKNTGVSCSVFIGPDGRPIGDGGRCPKKDELVELAEIAAMNGVGSVTTRSSIRDVFWEQASYILIAEPLMERNGGGGFGAAIMIPLDSLNTVLKQIQHIFLIYILINTAILTLLGIFRLNKLTVKPIQRLVTRAEEYRESEDAVFLIEKEDNEFSKLSKSLNSMLMRISGDKEKLQASVVSLEKANEELEKAQRELVRAEKLASVGRLSAGIAHEIGNPIGIVKGYLDLLKDNSLSPEERKEFVDRTGAEVERINSIIRQLLDFARPSADEQAIVSIHPILHELEDVSRFQPVLANHKFTLDLRAEKDQVMADGRQLRQVFLNLILNAADAFDGLDSPNENRLIIRTSMMAGSSRDATHWLLIQFIDNGAGIPHEHLEYIFDPFYTTKEPGRGTGLGLSVSFTIIDGFGGTIQAVANDMNGTTMQIRLPLAEIPEATNQMT